MTARRLLCLTALGILRSRSRRRAGFLAAPQQAKADGGIVRVGTTDRSTRSTRSSPSTRSRTSSSRTSTRRSCSTTRNFKIEGDWAK